MRKFSRQALGFISVLPGLWVLILGIENMVAPGSIDLDAGWTMHLHLFIVTLFAITWLCFIFHAVGSPVVQPGRRSPWVIALLIATVLAMPLYWHRYLRLPPQANQCKTS